MPDYSPPLDRLLTAGEPAFDEEWRDYAQLGLTPEHVPELIRMATDMSLHQAEGDRPEIWAPLHAWRALGQLRAEAAIEPLLQLLAHPELRDDDWFMEELPRVLGRMRPSAVPTLVRFLDPPWPDDTTRVALAEALKEIAVEFPETREAVVTALANQLERTDRVDPDVNGWIVAALLDLDAAEAAPAIERAYEAERVEPSIAGRLDSVLYELGVRDEPPEKAPFDHLGWGLPALSFAAETAGHQGAGESQEGQAQASRAVAPAQSEAPLMPPA